MGRRTRHAALVDSLCGRLRAWTARHAFASRERDPEGRTWYRIENAGPSAAATTPVDVFIYGEIGFWGVTAEAFLSDLGQVGSRDITLRINSEGGEVFDGVAIYNALQRHVGRIEGHVDGLAASAASFIAMACDELIIEPGAQIMIHDAIGMCYGNAAEMTKMTDMLHRTSDTIAAIYAERAGGEAADWRAKMAAEDTWYDGPAAVAAGLADRVGEARERRPGPVEDASRSKVTAYYGEAPGERDSDGRFKDGMPDVVASYAFATVSGALTAARTREGVELSDGANSVTVRPHEARRIERAMRSHYATEETVINRNVEIDGRVHVVTVARVRPAGRGQNEDGEDVTTGMRLDIGEVQDSDDYDARTGVTFTDVQADEPFAATLGNAEVAARVQTGYGPLDMYPTADGKGMTLRMKAESGHPTEVEFSRAEWQKINTAINTLIDGFGEDTPEGVEVNAITVPTKAGKVDLEWKGGRSEGGDYSADARLLITPQYDAPWSVVIGGEHMAAAFEPIGHINDAIGIDNRLRRLTIAAGRARVAPKRRPLAFRSRPSATALLWLPCAEVDGQPRDDDGRWTEFPGTGMAWSDYVKSYEVYDETTTDSGMVVVTMTNGEMQFAYDDAEEADVRHPLLDFTAEDNGPAELRDALRQAVDSDVQTDFELVEPDASGIWANVTRNAESITLFIPGAVEKNDFEIEFDLDEAEQLIDALDTQIERFNEIQDAGVSDTWPGLVYSVLDDTWTLPEWAAAHSTSEPVSSSISDHRSLWEAWA